MCSASVAIKEVGRLLGVGDKANVHVTLSLNTLPGLSTFQIDSMMSFGYIGGLTCFCSFDTRASLIVTVDFK